MKASRLARLAALAVLSFYSLLLLAAALPAALLPVEPLVTLKMGSGFFLHLLGVTSGLEVFEGRTALRAIPRMSCFRISGQGDRNIVLYDDLALCRERRVQAIRDPFRIFQMRSLSVALVQLNVTKVRDLRQDALRPLFLFSDYYCHVPEATKAHVHHVTIESLYVGMNLQDGSSGELRMGGVRECTSAHWTIAR